MNKVFIIGNCGRDAELRYTGSGSAVSDFSVAVSEKRGEKEETEWFNVVLFGKAAESLTQYLTKGKQVMVEGRLRTSSWEKDGQKHYRTEVIAQNVQLLGGRREG